MSDYQAAVVVPSKVKQVTVWSPPAVLVTSAGKPMTWWIDKQVTEGRWRLEVIPAEIVGLSRPLAVFRASRKTNSVYRVAPVLPCSLLRWHFTSLDFQSLQSASIRRGSTYFKPSAGICLYRSLLTSRRYHATKRAIPSTNGVLGSYPSNRRALLTSA